MDIMMTFSSALNCPNWAQSDLGSVASEEAAGTVDQGIPDLSTPHEARE
jgi:hypothetical protein